MPSIIDFFKSLIAPSAAAHTDGFNSGGSELHIISPPFDPPRRNADLQMAFGMLEQSGQNRGPHVPKATIESFDRLVKQGLETPGNKKAASREMQDVYAQARDLYIDMRRLTTGKTPNLRGTRSAT